MGIKLIKVRVSKRGYSYIHRSDESDPSTQTNYSQAEVDNMQDAEIHEFEGSYLDLEKKNQEKIENNERLINEIKEIEQECMRPLIEIHYLQEQGKDIAKEKAFLNQRYAQILQKRAELQALDNA